MSGNLRHTYEADSGTEQADIRGALSDLTDDDLSKKSPVTAGAREVSVQMRETDDGHEVEIVVEGHGGEWSKTSEQAVRKAVQSADGVGELLDSEGGYESSDTDEE